ncbi:putative peptidase family M28 [Rosellinia necatrix]|uniref:Peptide hydrolase n=1 Tax=Rosellinia necatrix TaxID=77044 RepID=A0A1W2TF73_ROSNE|nr:putative peptidase family M28 [Rosellinia necatrix]
MASALLKLFFLGLSTSRVSASLHVDSQVVLGPSTYLDRDIPVHVVDDAILVAVQTHPDPVDALVSLRPELADELAEPRLLHVFGHGTPQWMTEGDKLRLRRNGRKFKDITDYQDEVASWRAGHAHLPELSHQALVKPLFPKISTDTMRGALTRLTSFYNRYYGDVYGEQSAQWLHGHIADIIASAPFHSHISLEYFTHPFPQPSIIARFEPKVRNSSLPLTIIGAHQDSANYLFPLLPAPGADDDGSGTVSILEAFRVLAQSGFVPKNGPVEFHWYAAEEGGLLGSQAIARDKRQQGATIGAMLEFDMTAYIARNSTPESVGLIDTDADDALTAWVVSLAEEYISIPAAVYSLSPGAGSDYMSFTQNGFPSAFASEGNPLAEGRHMGDFDPYVHTAKDTMDVDDDLGYFSFDHMAKFSELAIAFIVEQAGWDNTWR